MFVSSINNKYLHWKIETLSKPYKFLKNNSSIDVDFEQIITPKFISNLDNGCVIRKIIFNLLFSNGTGYIFLQF